MSAVRHFQNDQNLTAEFKGASAPLPLYEHFLWALNQLGKPSEATAKLIEACDQLMTANAGFSGAYFSPFCNTDSAASIMATNFLKTLSPPKDFKSLGVLEQGQAHAHFGFDSYESYAERHAGNQLPALPPLDPSQQRILDSSQLLAFRFPGVFSDNPQRASLFTEEQLAEALNVQKGLALLSPLFEQAILEWKNAGLRHPKANPFAKPLAAFGAGRWVERASAEALLEGTFWVAAAQNEEGVSFLSANGSHMREISRCKPFGSQQEALDWADRFGGSAALELSWKPVSFAPVRGRSNHSLETLFAVKESREIGEVTGEAPLPPAEAPRKRKGASL